MVNFWLYDVYSFEVSTYWVRIILLLLSYVITTIFLGVIVSLDIITMPLEALCMIISKSFNKSFTKLRQLSDVINTVISVLMSLIFHLSFSVREGSVLAMIIFAPMLGYFMKYEKPILSKNNLIDNSNVEKHTA